MCKWENRIPVTYFIQRDAAAAAAAAAAADAAADADADAELRSSRTL